MLVNISRDQLDDFVKKKLRQSQKYMKRIPGIGTIISGPFGTSFMMFVSTDAFYEGVIVGQWPQKVQRRVGKGVTRRMADVPEDQKPFDKRAIDFSDAMIERVIECWEEGRSALHLDFVDAVCNRDGTFTTK